MHIAKHSQSSSRPSSKAVECTQLRHTPVIRRRDSCIKRRTQFPDYTSNELGWSWSDQIGRHLVGAWHRKWASDKSIGFILTFNTVWSVPVMLTCLFCLFLLLKKRQCSKNIILDAVNVIFIGGGKIYGEKYTVNKYIYYYT